MSSGTRRECPIPGTEVTGGYNLTRVLGAKLDSSGRAEKMLLTVSLAPLPTLSKCFERGKSFVKFDNPRSPQDNITAQRRAGGNLSRLNESFDAITATFTPLPCQREL